ncbi:coiled-coil alpha-helical rod protein 1 isoform X3 [Acanthochromis polyacanthus]|uniref:coiled-coil alpha-helical rod protein 1 isoform X3 n=1 Tax=Acanthochromis polyacanthus TaxID=80966 RepID=UPI002234C94C|nr:coiled-coil alpha-helical rod protein 1 isoform X3 [Acanthochromis polyacanthus]
MERLTLGKERLVAPTDFTSPAVPRTFQEDLVPPSHFASSVQSSAAHRGVQIPAATPPICWVNSGVTSVSSVDPAPANPWLAITQAQQEILELKRENQRILMLQGGTIRSGISADHLSDIRARSIERGEQWSKWESDWRLEAEKYKAEAERLKGQVEALKETAGRYRDEMRETDTSLKRNSHELEAVHEELTKTKTELSQIREELNLSSAQKKEISSQLERLKADSGEEITKLRRGVERSKEESQELALKAEMSKLQAEEEHRQQTLRLLEQLEEMQKKQDTESLTDPLVKNGSEGLQVLQLWREKVFKLCVQLRLKDIELRREKDKLLSKVKSTEQQLQQEQHSASVLQHSLHDRIAELDLERVEKETLKLDLAKVHKENAYLKSQTQRAEGELKTLTEAVHRFNQGFESKVAEVDAAKAKLNTFTQRLTFAKRRVETIQGLLMRRAALQKVEQACKQGEQAAESIRNLEMEHSLVCEERDRLTQELKRTPELIEKALANLKEQYEGKARQQQQELQQSLVEVQQAVADREKAEQSLQQIQGQLEERNVSLEKLRRELLSQEEQSKQALKERVSEIEDQYAEKLREMAVQVNTARREHTKAVMTLRQFEREATRKQDERKETQRLESENKKRDLLKKQLKETEMDKSFLQVTADERGLIREYTRAHRTAVPRKQNSSERSCSTGAKVQLPADERLLCVLEELHTLSAAVANSSEDSAEEEGQSDSVGPSTGSLHS